MIFRLVGSGRDQLYRSEPVTPVAHSVPVNER
jgi:hypothetical protein